ncbi:YoaK family protein [Massilia sp. YMA4]|uniref:YoaK family protein n=1 Tax=Massilia sp. YMA4 TaxID=1593482 RepID=UPI000DD131E0|nr:YoaK family protein [Massilia sp. YMA4]AXA90211.1 DUF1275 domain-containing protein [Massilia sp. YMA4]
MIARPSDLFLAISLATLAGYVDTAGFVGLFGLFTAHVTGNFVLIGTELGHPGEGMLLLKFLAFPAFAAGVIGARLLANACERRGVSAIRPLLASQLLLLAAFTAAAIVGSPPLDPGAPVVLAAGMLGAAAMGIHNAAGKLVFGRIAPTTVMTGNVTELLINLTDCLTGHGTAAVRDKLARFGWPMLAFALGCILGGYGFRLAGFWCLLLPLATLVVLMVLSWPAPAASVPATPTRAG